MALPLVLLTWGEVHVFDRLFFRVPDDYGFVLESVRGVLSGTPVFKSWQHRLVGPWAVQGLVMLLGDPLRALRVFLSCATLGANALLYFLTRKRGATRMETWLWLGAFGLARAVLAFRLEYPWDEIDVIVFLAVGHLASGDRPLSSFLPLCAAATLNHETVLYVPLWSALSALEEERAPSERRHTLLLATATAAVIGVTTLLLRRALYIGHPTLAGATFEPLTPGIDNPSHIAHNLRQLLAADWIAGRAFIAASVLAAIAFFWSMIAARRHVTAARWSLSVIATIVAFGYVNETRHYLPLLAFWFGYGKPRA